MNKEVIIKALKEFGRIALIAILPILITSIEKGIIDYKSILVVGVIAVLKALDKLLHEMGLEKEEESGEESKLTTGITRF